MKTITILTPIYNEEESFLDYVESISKIVLSLKAQYTINVLFIDDGSTDKSWKIITSIHQKNPIFKGIRLSRNFGAHVALSAGINMVNSDAIVTLACDLQDPPSTILDFITEWENGYSIVWGKRKKRNDALWRKFTSFLFFNMLKQHAMPKGSKFQTGSFFLIDKKVCSAFKQFREYHRITFALVAYTGFNQTVVDYERVARKHNHSKWNFSKMISTMYDALIGFSSLPITLMSRFGILVFFLSSFSVLYFLYQKLVSSVKVSGWTGIMVSIFFFSGVIIMCLSIICQYLQRIYLESANRPLYFISDKTT